MEFLFPWGLLALALIPVLLLIHLLRVPGRIKFVSFLGLWDKVLSASATPVAPARRRFDALFILEALVVALLALALAQAATRWGTKPPDVALVLDMSASMGAESGDNRTRMDDALDRARTFLKQFDGNDLVTMVWCRGDSDLGGPIATKQPVGKVLSELRSYKPGKSPVSGDQIFRDVVIPLADQHQVVTFITDSLSPETAKLRPNVLCAAVGKPCDNIGIVRWSSAYLPDGRAQVFVSILNTYPTPQSGKVQISDGFTTAEKQVGLTPGGTTDCVIDFKYEKRTSFLRTDLVREGGPDGLPIDDTVYAEPTRVNVALLGTPCEGVNRFFKNVFPKTVKVTEIGSISELQGGEIVVACQTQQVTQGGVTSLSVTPAWGPGDEVAIDPYRTFGDNLQVTAGDDALMQSVDARSIHATRYMALRAPKEYRTFLWAGDQPIGVVKREAGHYAKVVLGINPDEGWAKEPSFVVFMVNLMRELNPTGELPDRPYAPVLKQNESLKSKVQPALLDRAESELPYAQAGMDNPNRLALPRLALSKIWQPVTPFIAVALAVALFLWWCWPR